MDNPKQALGNLAVLSLLVAGLVLCLYTCSSSFTSNELVSIHKESLCRVPDSATIDKPRDELDVALARASMENKIVIITIINKAYAEQNMKEDETSMLDLFLQSFWLGEGMRSLFDHLLIVTMDRTTYNQCEFLRLNCFELGTNGVDFEGERVYMSQDFIEMMWKRTLFKLVCFGDDSS